MPAIETIKLRRGTAAQWTSANPTLASGEPGLETDTGNIKIGDGTTAWTSLGYQYQKGAYVTPANIQLASAYGIPTDGTDAAPAINALPQNAGDIYFYGTLFCKSPIVLPNGTRLCGFGSRGSPKVPSVIKFDPTQNWVGVQALITLGSVSAVSFGTGLRDLQVDCQNIVDTTNWTGPIGVVSYGLQEHSGLERVLILNAVVQSLNMCGGAIPGPISFDTSGTFTSTAFHLLKVGQQVQFGTIVDSTGATNGGLGITTGTTYYVISTPTATTFTVSATSGGSSVTISASGWALTGQSAQDIAQNWRMVDVEVICSAQAADNTKAYYPTTQVAISSTSHAPRIDKLSVARASGGVTWNGTCVTYDGGGGFLCGLALEGGANGLVVGSLAPVTGLTVAGVGGAATISGDLVQVARPNTVGSGNTRPWTNANYEFHALRGQGMTGSSNILHDVQEGRIFATSGITVVGRYSGGSGNSGSRILTSDTITSAGDKALLGTLNGIVNPISLASPGSVPLTPGAQVVQQVTLGANCTSMTVSNHSGMSGDQVWVLKIVQDGTGGRTCALPASGILWKDGAPPAVPTLPGSHLLITFLWDGSNDIELSRSVLPGTTASQSLPVVAASEVSLSNSTTETELIAYTVPANSVQAGTTFRVTAGGTIDNIATSGTLTIRLRWGGVGSVTLSGTTIASQAGAATGQQWWADFLVTIRSTGASGSAYAIGMLRSQFSSTTAAAGQTSVTTVATNASKDLTITAQWATADPGNVCRLEVGSIQLVKT